MSQNQLVILLVVFELLGHYGNNQKEIKMNGGRVIDQSTSLYCVLSLPFYFDSINTLAIKHSKCY